MKCDHYMERAVAAGMLTHKWLYACAMCSENHTSWVACEQTSRVGAVLQAAASISAALDGWREAKLARCQECCRGGHHDLRCGVDGEMR